jgi:hypothetical protein
MVHAIGKQLRHNKMPSHVLQDRLEALVSSCLFITPFFLVSAVACALLRRHRWIAPYWVFSICPVIIIYWMLFQLVCLPGVSGPDGGFVGMKATFLLLGSLWEVIPGFFLLLAFPRDTAWGKHTIVPCCIAAVISLAGWIVVIPYIPVPH